MALVLVVTVLYFAVMGGILFASAGRLNLPMFLQRRHPVLAV
jgi:hypothetical protein